MKNREMEVRTGYYLIELIRAVFQKTTPPVMPKDVTVEAVYRMAKKHNLDCMAYEGICRVPEIDLGEYESKWKKRSMQCAMQGVVQLAERDKIYQVLPNAGVRILPLKGCLLKEMYPKKEYRQMSDLDMLIDDENAEQTKILMEGLGYETESFGDCHHDCYIKKPWCHVEIHRNMLPRGVENTGKYKDVWKHAYEEASRSRIYRFTWDDYYLFMLEHFAKHFREGGSGIRSIADIYVFLQGKKDALNPKYLEKRLKQLNLWEFKEQMEQIAQEWFVEGTVGRYEETEKMLIFSGAYGEKALRYLLKTEYLEKKYHSKFLARVHYMGEMVFLNYDGMCILYPVLKRYPVLLPLMWVHRMIKVVTKKRHVIKNVLQSMRKADKEQKEMKKC